MWFVSRLGAHFTAQAQVIEEKLIMFYAYDPVRTERNKTTTTTNNGEVNMKITLCINFLQTPRISSESVAENIITCLSWGVSLKIRWTSFRISVAIKGYITPNAIIQSAVIGVIIG